MTIKVCGLRQPENILAIDALGVDFIGLIRYAKSPRFVTDLQLEAIGRLQLKAKKVGVYVNESFDQIISDVKQYGLDVVQLHGDENYAFAKAILHTSKHLQVFKAIGVNDAQSIAQIKEFDQLKNDERFSILLDTKTKAYGGSGRKFDWSLLSELEQSFILSGGIKPEDAERIKALNLTYMTGIDLNSGFEIEAGLKNTELLSAFKKEIRP